MKRLLHVVDDETGVEAWSCRGCSKLLLVLDAAQLAAISYDPGQMVELRSLTHRCPTWWQRLTRWVLS